MLARRNISLGVASLALVILTLLAGRAIAQSLPVERAVEATYLYKFVPFVDWPQSAFQASDAPLKICILNDQAMADALAPTVAHQRDGGRPLAVRNVDAPQPDCNILFVPMSDGREIAGLLRAVRNKPILTVTSVPDSSSAHGVINFVLDNGHVRFDIDNQATSENGLTISSKLLSLARSVHMKGSAP